MARSMGWALCLLALGSCTETELQPSRARPTPTETRAVAQNPCVESPPPFEASYLPDGFGARLRRGAGLFRGTNYPTEGLLGHYLGPRETMHINFETDPGPLPYELDNTRRISTLGSNGRIASIEGGFAVGFTFRECDYRMDTYGISRKETLQVARGLISRNQRSGSLSRRRSLLSLSASGARSVSGDGRHPSRVPSTASSR